MENLSKIAIQNYWEKCHNFLDFRTTIAAVKPETNKLLFNLCNDVYSAVHEDKWHLNLRKTVEIHCNEIKKLTTPSMPSVTASLESFLLFWSTGDLMDLNGFRPWWGRGTQYVSVIKSP